VLLGLQQFVSNSVIKIDGQYQSCGVIGGVMMRMPWFYLTCWSVFWVMKLLGSMLTDWGGDDTTPWNANCQMPGAILARLSSKN